MNIFDICTFGFFTNYPLEAEVEKDVDFAHNKTGTLIPEELILDIDLEIEDEINIDVEVE